MKNNLTITTSKTLSNDEIEVLSLLYLPIIKKDAFSLFLFMYNLVDRKTLTITLSHNKIKTCLGFTEEEYEEARYKLESVGLINSFVKLNNLFLRLNKVFDAETFLNDSVLGSTLYSFLSEDDYKSLIDKFRVTNINNYLKEHDYQEVTKSFDYSFTRVEQDNRVKFTFKQEFNYPYKLFVEGFNVEKAFSLIPSSYIEEYQKKDDELIEMFKKNAFIYGLTEGEIAECFKQSVDINGKVSAATFSENASRVYNNKFHSSKPYIVNKGDVKFSSNHDKYAVSTSSFLSKLSNAPASSSDLKVASKIWEKFSIDISLVNYLIDYSFSINNHKMYPFAWYDKVLSGWLRAGVKTVDDAIDYVKKNDNKNYYSNSKKNNLGPKWDQSKTSSEVESENQVTNIEFLTKK